MSKKSLEERILETCRNQRRSVELRLQAYSEVELSTSAQAAIDCASALSRHLGKSQDDIIAGRDVFSRHEIELLLAALRKLQEQAVAKKFECGLTAILALKAIIGAVYIGKFDPSPAVREQRDRESRLMAAVMEDLLAHHPGHDEARAAQ